MLCEPCSFLPVYNRVQFILWPHSVSRIVPQSSHQFKDFNSSISKNEEYRPIALCIVCAIPHRAQPMMNYAGIVTSETCFVKWHQHITSNWVNGAHWPTKENKQTPICFCILGTWKLAWSGLKWHCDVSLLIQTLPTLWDSRCTALDEKVDWTHGTRTILWEPHPRKPCLRKNHDGPNIGVFERLLQKTL